MTSEDIKHQLIIINGTFLETLVYLHRGATSFALGTLYLRAAVHRRGQRPPKGLGTNNL